MRSKKPPRVDRSGADQDQVRSTPSGRSISRSACWCSRSPWFRSSGRGASAVDVVRSNRVNGYSLRLVLADFRCSGPLPTIPRFLNDTTVPGARLPALIRRRPVPVST